jgi:hypothetical protein
MMDVMVRFAAVDDVPAVKAIADRHRHELGFVPAAALVEAAQERLATRSPTCLDF